MKRRKKTTWAPGQLGLFDEAPRSPQTGEAKISPVAALKPSALTLIPPTPGKAVKTPQNGLKTKILSRDELNRLWKENPEALDTLNRMKKVNPNIMTLVQAFSLVPQEKLKNETGRIPTKSRGVSYPTSPRGAIYGYGARQDGNRN